MSPTLATVRLAALALLLSACNGNVDSPDLRTSGIYAEISVTGSGDSTTQVLVDLRTGPDSGSDEVRLSGSDQLIASALGQSQTLAYTSNLAGGNYVSTFSGNQANTRFSIALQRSTNDVSAPNSWVDLPSPFSIDSPSTSQTLPLGQALSVSWTLPGTTSSEMQIDYQLECSALNGGSVQDSQQVVATDNGLFNLNSNIFSLSDHARVDTSQPCQGQLQLLRLTSGSLDPAYGQGGAIYGKQVRSISFTLQP